MTEQEKDAKIIEVFGIFLRQYDDERAILGKTVAKARGIFHQVHGYEPDNGETDGALLTWMRQDYQNAVYRQYHREHN